MNLYTKLLCKLGLIKAPTLDIVQWIKDNPDEVITNDFLWRSFGFIYKNKEFHVYSKFEVRVDNIKKVFGLFEEMLIHSTVKNLDLKQTPIIPDNKRIRKELLE